MKQPNEEGYSIFWHSLLIWLEHVSPTPASARATLGRFVRDYGRDAVLLAFDRTLEANPRPVDPYTYFAKLVSSSDKPLGDAQTAWNTVVRLSSHCDTAKSQASVHINAVVAHIGGWAKIGHADKKTFGGLRSQFITSYKEVAQIAAATNAN